MTVRGRGDAMAPETPIARGERGPEARLRLPLPRSHVALLSWLMLAYVLLVVLRSPDSASAIDPWALTFAKGNGIRSTSEVIRKKKYDSV